MAPKACTPAYFGAFLARSWAEGTTKVRHLFSDSDIRHRGYTGSFSHLARFLAPWRSSSSSSSGEAGERPSSDEEAPAPPHVRTLDPMTGRQISPLTAAALCVKPRGQMTDRQIVNVDALKAASVEFPDKVQCDTQDLASFMAVGRCLRCGTARDAARQWRDPS